MRAPVLPVLALLAACGGSSDVDLAGELNILGGAESDDVSTRIEKMVGRPDGLDKPTDLDFNPDRPGELWVVNKNDDSTTIVFDAGTDEQTTEHRIDPYALHFMEKVTSISFGKPGTFGTCQDGDNTYNDAAPGDGFTGPTLWSSDLDVYAESNPDAVEFLSGMFGGHVDLGSHLDMLHESPECMGIAWEKRNVYWVFDGYNRSIARYDFKDDHGPGYDDHSDGVIAKWVSGEIKRKVNVPSHLEFDHASDLLYIADSGNNRVAVLDTKSGKRGEDLSTWEPGTEHYEWDNGDIQTLIDGSAHGMGAPSGLALVGDVLFVGDNETGVIFAFDLQGNLLDKASTGLPKGGLTGIVAPSTDEIWFADQKGDAVYRLLAPSGE